MSSNPLNFAPYSSPPSSPTTRSSVPRGGRSTGNSARPKTPWFSSGSYQSGAKTSDLNSANHVASSSSTYHSAEAGPSSYASQGQTALSSDDVLWDAENGYAGPSTSLTGAGGNYSGHDAYDTTYGWRVDIEAAATYIAGPILAIILLILETKNDYVRFNAWQSLMLGAGLAILHLLLFWSQFFTRILFLVDIGMYGNLAYRAFLGGNNLERYFLPRIGEIASQWTEEE